MRHGVTVRTVPSRHVAIVRDRRRWAELGGKLIALLDRVYVAVRAGQVKQAGHNIFIYRDGTKDDVTVEIGVEVGGPFEPVGDVICVTTPAGEVASVLNRGPVAGLGAAHAAVHLWCRENGRPHANVWWEIYGDWQEDPAQFETEVVYALAPRS